MSRSDYQMMMSVLSGNLAEGQTKQPDLTTKSSAHIPSQHSDVKAIVTGKDSSAANISTAIVKGSEKEKAHIFLKFTFSMEQLIASLFTGSSEEVSVQIRVIENCTITK